MTPSRMCEEGVVTQIHWAPRVFLRRNLLTEQERLTILKFAQSKIGAWNDVLEAF